MRFLEESDSDGQKDWWAPGAGEGSREFVFWGDGVSVWGDDKLLEVTVVTAARHHERT